MRSFASFASELMSACARAVEAGFAVRPATGKHLYQCLCPFGATTLSLHGPRNDFWSHPAAPSMAAKHGLDIVEVSHFMHGFDYVGMYPDAVPGGPLAEGRRFAAGAAVGLALTGWLEPSDA